MIFKYLINKLLKFTLFVITLFTPAYAVEVNPDGWELPQMDEDKDKCSQNDMVWAIKVYRNLCKNAEGNFYSTFVAIDKDGNKNTYMIQVDTTGKIPWEFILVDLEGDGVFRHKFEGAEKITDPEYLYDMKKYPPR